MFDEITKLKLENKRLRALLEKNNISYTDAVVNKNFKITSKNSITAEKLRLFQSLFRGRTDVYSKRSAYPDKKTGKVGYYAQIDHTCKTEKRYLPLTWAVLKNHLCGNADNYSDVIGMYPLLKNDSCYFLVLDFDNHDADKYSTDKVRKDVDIIRLFCAENNIPAHVERSRSGDGAHIWFFFEEAIDAALATPVSWSGILEQYVGRLHRDYSGKDRVFVYDYVDGDVPVFYAMYKKRLKTYKNIGYNISKLY